jgi:hypothetical protein
MRSLVITAVILIFCALSSVLYNASSMLQTDTGPTSGLNQSTVQGFSQQAGITTGTDGQNAFYTQGISVISLLTDTVTGTIFIGSVLQNWGMDEGLADAINVILGIVVGFDLLMFWRGIAW